MSILLLRKNLSQGLCIKLHRARPFRHRRAPSGFFLRSSGVPVSVFFFVPQTSPRELRTAPAFTPPLGRPDPPLEFQEERPASFPDQPI